MTRKAATFVGAGALCLSAGACGSSSPRIEPADLPLVDDHYIAVWEGQQPATNKEAARIFDALDKRYIEGRPVPPTDRIRKYVRALLSRYPDLTMLPDSKVDDSPWGDGPLIGDASGPVAYFEIVGNAAGQRALRFAAKVARDQGLVYYDDTTGRLSGR